jgi:casein kinase 1
MTVSKMNVVLLKILDVLEHIHKFFTIHRDIKPQNFMIKDGDIFLIDFGLATFYITDSGEHFPNVVGNTMVGTPKYASIHIHNGCRYSRRDDLISLGYLYLCMILGGDCPWLCPDTDIHSVIHNTTKSITTGSINKFNTFDI